MSRLQNKRLTAALSDALIVALTGLGLALLILGALFGAVDWMMLLTGALATALITCLLHALLRRWTGLVFLAGAALLALGCVNVGPLTSSAQALRVFWIYPDLAATALPPYRAVLTWLTPVLTTGLCAGIVFLGVPTGTLTLMAMASILLGARLTGVPGLQATLGAAACTVGFLLALARERTRLVYQPLLIGLIAAAVVFLLLPPALPNVPALKNAAEDLYMTLDEYLPGSDENARSGFTLETEGYLPLGSESPARLGGPADPDDRVVMEVATARPLYLRGIAMNHYSGLNWTDTLSSRRYLYADLLMQNYRRQIFDEYLPLRGEGLKAESAFVHMLSAAATTLYAPQRLRSLEMRADHMTPYYNAGSELFLTRDLAAGDSYAFTYLPLDADSETTARLIEAARAVSDSHYAETAQIYTALPSHIQRDIYALSVTAAGGEETPYRRALAIRDYLRTHYPYALDVSVPPDNVDFVTWFLLRERKGYCTYFASALTVLCRLQGIPARYVTGYHVKPAAEGMTTVTSADAHAWTEIYLNGFGWLTLDATPGYEGDDSSSEPAPEGGASQEPESTPTPAPDEPPAATPTPEPTPEPASEPGAPSPEPSPLASEPPETPEAPARSGALPILLLLIVLAAAACPLCYVLMDPLGRARRHPDRAADILLGALDRAMALLHRPRRPDETLIAYYADAARLYPDLPLSDLAAAYSARLYGRKNLRAEALIPVWESVDEKLRFLQRIRVRFGRS